MLGKSIDWIEPFCVGKCTHCGDAIYQTVRHPELDHIVGHCCVTCTPANDRFGVPESVLAKCREKEAAAQQAWDDGVAKWKSYRCLT